MKTFNFYSLSIGLVCCLCLLSCSNEKECLEEIRTEKQGGEIEIWAGIVGYMSSKSTETGFEIGDSIGIFVVKRVNEAEVALPAETGNYGNNVKWVKTADGWTPATDKDKLNFPADASGLDFYAYYPYNRKAINPQGLTFQVKANQSTQTEYVASDLMMAVNKTGITEGKIELVFRHQLSMIMTEFVPASGVNLGDTPGARIDKVATKVKLDWNTGSCTPLNESTENVMMFRTADAGFHYRAIVPAQSIIPYIYCLKAKDEYRFIGVQTEFKVNGKNSFKLTVK